ncbi:ArsR/SmtB family transcription factor [Arthrobacter glacialis]|uniref:ArsR/SmtB family transcription factor n=1 Tax=Arthrobacter glacialis TaxID=1664 RepID=UPI001FAECE3F|nr:helix-turn-helix domain-containing protein [Arthrobacter glacialis]
MSSAPRLITNHGLNSSRQSVSQHLDIFEGAVLVQARREGRYKFHYINTAPLDPIMGRWGNQSGGSPSSGAAIDGEGSA